MAITLLLYNLIVLLQKAGLIKKLQCCQFQMRPERLIRALPLLLFGLIQVKQGAMRNTIPASYPYF